MKLIKTLMLLVFLCVLAFAGFYYAANHGYVSAEQVALVQGVVNTLPIRAPAIKQGSNSGSFSTSKVVSDLKLETNTGGSVLGETIQIETQQPPLHQRAFEYARYTYCQEVVRDYQQRYPASSQ